MSERASDTGPQTAAGLVELRAAYARTAAGSGASPPARLERFDFVAGPAGARALCEAAATDPTLPAQLAARGYEVRVRPAFRTDPAARAGSRVRPREESGVTVSARADELTRDLGALAARVFRPPRAKLAEALAVVLGLEVDQVRPLVTGAGRWTWQASARTLAWKRHAGAPRSVVLRASRECVDDPREAWEALAARGVIPDAWIDAPARRFVALREDEPTPGAAAPAPHTLREVVAYAADAEAMTAAEALSREALSRLAHWGVAAPAAVHWCHARTAFFDRALVPEALGALLPDQLDPPRAMRLAEFRRAIEPYGNITREAEEVVVLALAWQQAVERGARVPASAAELRAQARARGGAEPEGCPLPPEPVRGAPFRALPDPFEPMVQVLARGCLLLDVRPAAATLVLPPM